MSTVLIRQVCFVAQLFEIVCNIQMVETTRTNKFFVWITLQDLMKKNDGDIKNIQNWGKIIIFHGKLWFEPQLLCHRNTHTYINKTLKFFQNLRSFIFEFQWDQTRCGIITNTTNIQHISTGKISKNKPRNVKDNSTKRITTMR